jgi:teichuronic acid biosynthesis glycosyltransferase TuaC
MHLCVVSPGFPTSKTIDFVFVEQLCKAFSKQGNKITIIAPQSITKSIIRGIPVINKKSIIRVLDGNDIVLYRPYYFSFGNTKLSRKITERSFNKSIQNSLRKIKQLPDVCYGHFWKAVFPIYPFAKKNKIPLIASSGEELVTFHNDYSTNELKGFIKYIKGVISVSTKNKNENVQAGLTKENECSVILNAVDETLFYIKDKIELRKSLGFNERDFIVAFVGQFNDRKGVLRLSNALSLLKDDSIKAIFIGSGIENPDYSGTIFKGTVSHDILPDFLNCADVFVLPTLNEGCSNAIIEAMACGLPIISSNLPFNSDILNKVNSILVNPNNINEISTSIKFLKDNEKIRKEMALKAIDTSMGLTISKRAENILKFINDKVKQ